MVEGEREGEPEVEVFHGVKGGDGWRGRLYIRGCISRVWHGVLGGMLNRSALSCKTRSKGMPVAIGL